MTSWCALILCVSLSSNGFTLAQPAEGSRPLYFQEHRPLFFKEHHHIPRPRMAAAAWVPVLVREKDPALMPHPHTPWPNSGKGAYGPAKPG